MEDGSVEQATGTRGWVPERVEEILDSCGLCGGSCDLGDEGAKRDKDKRNLLRPLAREVATLENDLRQCRFRDTKYFALLKAYEQALTTLKKL